MVNRKERPIDKIIVLMRLFRNVNRMYNYKIHYMEKKSIEEYYNIMNNYWENNRFL